IGILERHLQTIVVANGGSGERNLGAPVGRRQPERQAVRGGDLAGEAEHAQTVGPIRGHLEIDDPIAARQRLDRRDLEAANAERAGDVLRRGVDVHEVAKPRDKETHYRSTFSFTVQRSRSKRSAFTLGSSLARRSCLALHQYGNCSRNLKSFSKKSRMSSTWYRKMAIRSIPMPHAKPVYRSAS